MDSATLQHAAARLRKTGYYEQIRGDVPNLPDGRVDGPNQRVADGDRTHGSQFNQLDLDPPREQVHAAPAHSYRADSIGDVRGRANPSVKSYGYGEPSLPSSFDAVPKNLYQTFNNPSSKAFIENKLESPYRPSYNTAQPYSTTASYTSTPPPAPPPPPPPTNVYCHRNVSPQQAYAPPHYENQPYAPPNYDNRPPPPPPQQQQQPYTAATATQYRTSSPGGGYNYQSYTRESSHRQQDQHTRPSAAPVTLEWNTPYVRAPSPILNPHDRIREFATNNYIVEPEPPTSTHEYVHTVRRETHTRNAPEDFATTLRNQGLTSTQREANQYQSSTIRRDHLPFDVNHIYKQSYSGDEVDRLVNNMETELHLNRSQTHTLSPANNECVCCKKPITDSDPGCTAMNQIFHINCFTCKKCGKKLAGSSFYNIDNAPTCKPCYESTLEKCTKCGKKITDRLLRAHGGVYHVECFTCASCNRTLDGVPFTTDPQNNVYCVHCYQEKFAPRCAVCNQPIVPRDGEKEAVRVIAMEKSFHPTCYKCEDCGLQLSSKVDGAACYPLNSHLYCKTCNGNRLRAQATSA